jgi:holdfast attachment protein HfaA
MRLSQFIVSLGVAGGAFAASAAADPVQDRSFIFEQPLGMEFSQWERPFEPGTRDANGNRVVINGRLNDGESNLPLGIGLGEDGFSGLGQGIAIGNQLNVITNGNNNTIIIDNNQINNGNQAAQINGGRQ